MKKSVAGKIPRNIEKEIPPLKSRRKVAGLPVIYANGKQRVFLLKSELKELMGDWPKEVDRMLYAARNGNPWLTIVSNASGSSGSKVRVTAESASLAFQRLIRGERPPLMPSQGPKAGPRSQPKGLPDKIVSAFLRAGQMLPAGVRSATFNQKLKTVSISWENRDFQSIRKSASKGRNTKVLTVTFAPSTKDPAPTIRRSRKDEALEPGEF